MGFFDIFLGGNKQFQEDKTMEQLKIGIIMGSTREGRVSPQVAVWVKQLADQRGDAEYEIIDIADFKLPLFGEAGADASGAEA